MSKNKLNKKKTENQLLNEEISEKNESLPSSQEVIVETPIQAITVVQGVPESPGEQKPNKRRGLFSRNKNSIFLFVYLYLIARIFITDIDLILVNRYLRVEYGEYIVLRFLVLSIIFFGLWKKLGNKRFWNNIGLFAALPIYPGLWIIIKNSVWRFPYYLVKKKQDFLLYLYAEVVLSLIVRFKTTILKVLIFILGFYITFFTESSWLLIIGIVLLFLSQLLHLYKRWRELFGPVKVLQMTFRPIEDDNEPITLEAFEKSIKNNVENAKKDKKDPVVIEMEQYILMHELMKAFDKKVKEILTSQTYIKTFILRSFYSFVFAMVIFGGINYCLYKINPSHFTVGEKPGYFEFFYYSFFNIISEGVDIEPISRVSKSFRMIGVSIGVLINFLILAVYFTVNSERYKKNLENMNLWISKFSNQVNNQYHQKYNHSPQEGESVLKSAGSELIKHLNDLRELLKRK